MAPALRVGSAFSPLDEQLGLLRGGLTPRGQETLVRLSSWMPYECAREFLEDLLGIGVSKASARRATIQAGQTALEVWDAEVERLVPETPQAPSTAEKQAMSADGAMVHLVGGEWTEVKTLALGEVTRCATGEVRTEPLSYCSRLCDAASLAHATLLHTHRRGLDQASEVCAVHDGAEWLQGLVDYPRADAVRILDFAHAAQYINDIGHLVLQAGGRVPARWLQGVLHRLKHQGPARVLRHLAWLAARSPSALMQEKVTYVHKREAQMQYPSYQEAGWPIGSGSVESANKLVVEARLKGAGMRWARPNVNPMLGLRHAVCTREWQHTCDTALAHRQGVRTHARHTRSQRRWEHACWFLAAWGLRVYRLSHPSASVAPTTTRPGSKYSWRKPFLRPLPPRTPGEVGAKK